MSTERLSAGILSVLLLCLLDAGAAPARLAAQEAAPPSAIDTLRAEVETLERQVELATGKGFYLVLDPRAPGLRLMFEGAVLQQFPVSSIDVGAPRLFFRSPDTIEPWEPSIWRQGTLAPMREVHSVILEPPPPGASADHALTTVPPTAEEAIPVPRRYFIRFAGGLAIEVDQSVDPVESYMSGYVRRLGDRWQDVRAVASDAARDRMRVRVVLDREVAEALYRSVPDDVGLLVAARPTS